MQHPTFMWNSSPQSNKSPTGSPVMALATFTPLIAGSSTSFSQLQMANIEVLITRQEYWLASFSPHQGWLALHFLMSTVARSSGEKPRWVLWRSRVLDALFGKDSDNEAGNEININFHGVNGPPNYASGSSFGPGSRGGLILHLHILSFAGGIDQLPAPGQAGYNWGLGRLGKAGNTLVRWRS